MSGPAVAAAAATIAMEAKAFGMAMGGEPLDGTVRPTKLFIGGISRRTTTKQLRDHFSTCGRVLDCVAMRQPDGRPRGFGYVTLDSPAAAQFYLSEPQMIDNRYVDLKPAVPDASMVLEQPIGARRAWPMQEPTRLPMEDRANPFATTPLQNMTAPGLCLPIMGTSAWHMGDMALDFENASPLSILTRQAMAAPAAPPALDRNAVDPFGHFGAGLISRPVPPSETLSLRSETVPAKVQLPSAASPKIAPFVELEQPAAAKAPLREVTNAMPLREVTNLIDDNGAKKCRLGLISAEPLKPRGLGAAPRELPLQPPPYLSVRTPQAVTKQDSFFILEDEDLSPVVPTRQRSPSPTPSAAGSEDSVASTRPSAASPSECSPIGGASLCEGAPLPTVGSAKHFSGDCRRCNFFAKGRCRNGYDCSFCHFPHDRRKLSRQEKREAKLARLIAKQNDSPTSEPFSEPAPQGVSPGAQSSMCDFTPLVNKVASFSSSPEERETRFVAPPPGLTLDQPDFTGAAAAVALPPGLAPPGLPPPPHLEAARAWPIVTPAKATARNAGAATPARASSKKETVEKRTIATQTEEDYPCCSRCMRATRLSLTA